MHIGCHGSVWTGTFDEAGLQTAVSRTVAAGFDLLEIPLMDPESFNVRAARQMLEQHGLAATASLGLSDRTDISSEDTAVVTAGEALLEKCLNVVSDVGGTHLVGVIYCAMQKYMDPPSALGTQHSLDTIGRLAARGLELGVTLGIEVVNRYETNLCNTGRQGLNFVEQVGHDNVCVHLDSYHMNIEESDMFSPVLACRTKLGYVHIGESHRGYLGSGTVDFDGLFRALALVGYDGPVVFESFSSTVVHEDLSRMLGIWRNLWNDPDDLGAHANRFIRSHLQSVASIDMH